MSSLVVRPCECPRCRAGEPHPDRVVHQHINLLVCRLDEQQRRWFVALEAERRGRGGDTLLAQITGLNRRTIRRGRRELAAGLAERPTERVRAPGGGRPAREAQDPALLPALEALLAPETAGDPMGRRAKAKRSSLQHLSAALSAAGHPASRPTVARLLRQLGCSPKVNARRAEARGSPPERDAQFRHIAEQREQFQAAGEPIISVDTKKKGAGRQLQERRADLAPNGRGGAGA
jgi:Rhodopirellula transposase DDE domain